KVKEIQRFLPALLLFLFTLSACSNETQSEKEKTSSKKQEDKVLQLNASSEIPGINPTMADNSLSFKTINQIFEGLYRLDQEGDPQLAMAASKPKVSENHKVYTFDIRKDATWSD